MAWGVALAATLAMAGGGITAASATVKPHASVVVPGGKYGGHLTVVSLQASGTWVGMDPFLSNIPPGTAAMFPVFDPLFNLIPSTGQIVSNSLATGYTVSNGGLKITINLRKGIKFQDGTAFNAAAVVWNLLRYQNPTVNSECAAYLTVVSSITPSGPYQVAINLSQRDAGLIPLLATQQCALMVSPAAYQSEGANFTNDPVGTGPFKFLSGTPGSIANFVRNPTYWGGKPYLSEVTIEAVSSDSAGLTAVQSGAAQAWLSFFDVGSVPEILQARADKSLVVTHGAAGSITYITFSFTHSPFDNELARQAVTYATDPAAIDKSLYSNVYKPIQGIFPPSSFAFTGGTEPAYPAYNLAKAQQLVSQIGGLSFNLLVANTPATLQLCEALQAQWKLANINVTLQPVTTAQLITNLHALTYQALEINSPGLPDPDNIAYRWFYSGSALTQNGLKSPTADKLILAARADYGQAARKANYQKLNNFISGLAPWDDIAATAPYNIMTKKLHNALATPYTLYPWASMYLS
jgi:peptide/nickel transport system substrate-binding protein